MDSTGEIIVDVPALEPGALLKDEAYRPILGLLLSQFFVHVLSRVG